MRVQKRAARRRREARRVKIGGSWRLIGKIVKGGADASGGNGVDRGCSG